MPSYPFVCPKCGAETARFKTVAARDINPPRCMQHRETVLMKRKPAVIADGRQWEDKLK